MPELPEVETTRRGIAPHVEGRVVRRVVVRQPKLRWPVSCGIGRQWCGQVVDAVERRGKYLLFRTGAGTALVHLGMSGSLRLVEAGTEAGKHDHVDVELDSGRVLRLRDPRRFGALLWTRGDPLQHRLLAGLGPEPLGEEFDGAYLYGKARGRTRAVKLLLMDAAIVVGVGNIYANEALFLAGVHPKRKAGTLSAQRCEWLVEKIRLVLGAAIEAGGTTLRDFVGGEGRPGYFEQELQVYGREGEACLRCGGGSVIRRVSLGQRSTWYCGRCQR